MMQIPEHCNWSKGKINSAAIFLETCIKYSTTGTRIVAILPDVLRSGSRYDKWREIVSQNNEIDIKIVGRFDSKTDVDVFLLYGNIGKSQSRNSLWLNRSKNNYKII